MNGKRETYFDAIKGLGIISIVIGHASWEISVGNYVLEIGPFVYLYHLAIFLFCSGYFIKDKQQAPTEFIAKKIKSLYKPFVIYSLLYLFTRGIFIDLGLLSGTKYTFVEWIIAVSNILTFNSIGEFLGAFWFVPMMFFGIVIYVSIVFFTQRVRNVYIRETIRGILYLFIGFIGVVSVEKRLGLLYNLQISYLMIPIIALGGYYRKLQGQKYINVVGCLISLCILIGVLKCDIGIIELSDFRIINRWLFYPVTFCGIYFCLSFVKYITKIGIINYW